MPSIETIKMEDRKRPALDDDGRLAPPAKRQVINGTSGTAHPDADMPWKDDVEVSCDPADTLVSYVACVSNLH